jgi:hypothetical protein
MLTEHDLVTASAAKAGVRPLHRVRQELPLWDGPPLFPGIGYDAGV